MSTPFFYIFLIFHTIKIKKYKFKNKIQLGYIKIIFIKHKDISLICKFVFFINK